MAGIVACLAWWCAHGGACRLRLDRVDAEATVHPKPGNEKAGFRAKERDPAFGYEVAAHTSTGFGSAGRRAGSSREHPAGRGYWGSSYVLSSFLAVL